MSGNVCGYVVRGEQPVADAAITVVQGPGDHVDLSPLTDNDGWFALDDLQAGRWQLRAYAPDGSAGEAAVDIWDDSLSEVTISVADAQYPTPTNGRPDVWREPDPDLDAPRPRYRKPRRPANEDLPPAERPAVPGSVFGQVTDATTGAPVAGAVVLVTD